MYGPVLSPGAAGGAGCRWNLPSKNIHQFTAVTGVLMYFSPDGAFDIHYVDKDWKEIPPEQALQPAAKQAAAAKSSTKQ